MVCDMSFREAQAVNLQVRKKPTLVILQGACGESLFMQESESEKSPSQCDTHEWLPSFACRGW